MRKSFSLRTTLVTLSCVLACFATGANAALAPALSCADMQSSRTSAIDKAKDKVDEMATYKDLLEELDIEAQCLVHLSQAMSQYVGSPGGLLGELSSLMESQLGDVACDQAKQYAKQAQRDIENKVGDVIDESGVGDAAKMVMDYERQLQQEVERQTRAREEAQRKRIEALAEEARRKQNQGGVGDSGGGGGNGQPNIWDLLGSLY